MKQNTLILDSYLHVEYNPKSRDENSRVRMAWPQGYVDIRKDEAQELIVFLKNSYNLH